MCFLDKPKGAELAYQAVLSRLFALGFGGAQAIAAWCRVCQ